MPARQHETCQEKFTSRHEVEKLNEGTTVSDLLAVAASVVAKGTKNAIVNKHGIDWSNYRPIIADGVGYVVRERCERCNKVVLPPGQRKLRKVETHLGPVYLDTGICKDCINASIYVDRYLDGDPLSETEAKALFYQYAQQYEKQWRITLATAPRIAMTASEWRHRCNFFGGCALCGGFIEVQAKYFPTSLNGFYTSWNIIPLCGECAKRRGALGKRRDPAKAPHRYKVFSTSEAFQKTKTIRLFLLAQMEYNGVYMDNLVEFRQRFFEKQILKGSLPTADLPEELMSAAILLSRTSAAALSTIVETINSIRNSGIPDDDVLKALMSVTDLETLKLLAVSIRGTLSMRGTV